MQIGTADSIAHPSRPSSASSLRGEASRQAAVDSPEGGLGEDKAIRGGSLSSGLIQQDPVTTPSSSTTFFSPNEWQQPGALQRLASQKDQVIRVLPPHALHLEVNAEAIERLNQKHVNLFDRIPLKEFSKKLDSAVYSNKWRLKLETLEREVVEFARMETFNLNEKFRQESSPLPFARQSSEVRRSESIRKILNERQESKIENLRKERIQMIGFMRQKWADDEVRHAIYEEIRQDRDVSIEKLVRDYNTIVDAKSFNENEGKEIADGIYASCEKHGILPGSLAYYLTLDVARKFSAGVGLRSYFSAIENQKKVLTDEQETDTTLNFLAREVRFREELTTKALKDMLDAAFLEKTSIVSSGEARVTKNLALLGRLELMLDPNSRYHQALQERIKNGAFEKSEKKSYQDDMNLLLIAELEEEAQPVKKTKKKKKKQPAIDLSAEVTKEADLSGFGQSRVAEPQGSAGASLPKKGDQEVGGSLAGFSLVTKRQPKSDPARAVSNEKIVHSIVPWGHFNDSLSDRNIFMVQAQDALDTPAVYGETHPKQTGSVKQRRWLSWKAVAGMDHVKVEKKEQKEGILVISLHPYHYVRQETVTTFGCPKRRAYQLLLHSESSFDQRLGESTT